MAQQLRELLFFQKTLASGTGTHIRWLTVAPRDPLPYCDLGGHPHTCMHSHSYINKKLKALVIIWKRTGNTTRSTPRDVLTWAWRRPTRPHGPPQHPHSHAHIGSYLNRHTQLGVPWKSSLKKGFASKPWQLPSVILTLEATGGFRPTWAIE